MKVVGADQFAFAAYNIPGSGQSAGSIVDSCHSFCTGCVEQFIDSLDRLTGP